MKIRFTSHVESQIYARKLSREEILSTIRNHDVLKNGQNGAIVVQKGFNHGKLLEVVYKQERNIIIIITAYYDEKN